MTSITESMPAAIGVDRSLARPARFARFAAAVRLSAMASVAISSMSSTPIVSETKRETHPPIPKKYDI